MLRFLIMLKKSRIIYSDKEGKNDIVEENYEKPLLCGNLKAEIYFFPKRQCKFI